MQKNVRLARLACCDRAWQSIRRRHSELRLNLAGKLTWLAQVCLTYGLQYMVYILSMNTNPLKSDVSLCCKVFKSPSKVRNFAHQIQM